MRAHHFDLVSHWRLEAPPERVWAALVDTHNWPRWWPFVRRVDDLRGGDVRGVGRVRRIEWATRLSYRLHLEMEVVDVVKGEMLRARSRGHLNGEGIWLLRPDGACTNVTYVWRVELPPGWMRWLAPLLAPLFRWSHETVMRAGGVGLGRYLAGA